LTYKVSRINWFPPHADQSGSHKYDAITYNQHCICRQLLLHVTQAKERSSDVFLNRWMQSTEDEGVDDVIAIEAQQGRLRCGTRWCIWHRLRGSGVQALGAYQ